MTKPPSNDQGPAFPHPLSTNCIVRALHIRAQRYPWAVKNRVPTIGAVCGKACALAQVAVESTLWQAEVRRVSSIFGDMQLSLRHKLLLGATPCSANGASSSRGSRPQANSPCPGLGVDLLKTNKYKKKNYSKEKLQVLDRTKALHGPRTQAYGETKYAKEKL